MHKPLTFLGWHDADGGFVCLVVEGGTEIVKAVNGSAPVVTITMTHGKWTLPPGQELLTAKQGEDWQLFAWR